MGLSVTFVSGLRGCGKSTIILEMIDRLWKKEPHYIRLVKVGSDKRPPRVTTRPPKAGVASARWLEYQADNVFEVLSEALTAIHKKDRFGSVVLEAETDPVLRHAYPYDHRVFIMPMPETINTVFRDPRRAATELQHVLDDTAAFASEIFGLFDEADCDDVDPSEPRQNLSDTGMRGFLYSPLGDELATRIQLQPAYHGLVESDVIIVNTSVGAQGSETTECLRRVERLLKRVRGSTERHGELFLCDPKDHNNKTCKKMMKTLGPMCRGGK